jgi:hypothetical protein
MNETQNLKLPLLKQGQLNKDITLNEALMLIDCILNSGLESSTRHHTPPSDLENGKLILTSDAPKESFEKFPNHIAFYTNGWRFIKPKEGLILWVKDVKSLFVFDGMNFIQHTSNASGAENLYPQNPQNSSQNSVSSTQYSEMLARIEALERKLQAGEKNDILINNGTDFAPSNVASHLKALGVNTDADLVQNKLSVRSNSNLFATETGNVRLVLNKSGSHSISSFLFQNNWQGRAEFGNIGSDNFILKVSASGSSWLEVFEVDVLTGRINFKQDVLKNGVKIF